MTASTVAGTSAAVLPRRCAGLKFFTTTAVIALNPPSDCAHMHESERRAGGVPVISNSRMEVVMRFLRRLVLLVLVQALMAGAAFAQAKATPAEAMALADKAVAHIKAVGPDKAFA